MTYPAELKYTKEHEWIKVEGKTGTIGVTKFAIDQLGDVVYLDLPKIGTVIKLHDTFGTIESTKTVSDLFSPASGKVVEVNTNISQSPDKLVTDAYQNGWLIKIEIENLPTDLLSAKEYEKYVTSSDH